jgi:cobalt-zinc-cadmium resistance protein CzcA
VIERIIRGSARAPFLALLGALSAAVLGVLAYGELPHDVFPDLSAPVFNIIVQNAAMGAEELETAIAIPLETALSGLPRARRVRSNNQAGVTQITVEFEPDADYYLCRQLVAERVAQVAPHLPPGTEAPLLSSLTVRLNEIMELTLEAQHGQVDLMTLRDLAEFEIRNRLLAVPGVSAVERLGGYLRQFQVQLDPERMLARDVTLDEVLHGLSGANQNASGGFIVQGPMEWNVRALGRAQSSDDLRSTVVAIRGRVPVTVGDVADVREAPALRRGLAHRLSGEVVSIRIVKQFGADTARVSQGVKRALAEISRSLPRGAQLTLSYDQADLIDRALSGVRRAVLLGAGFVAVVLLLLLGDVRAAALVMLTIPLSICAAGLLLQRAGVGLNTMTLGGLAVSVGLLVDASIIMVENVAHRIQGTLGRADREQTALNAALEVGRPIVFATLIVVAVFLPLFGMQGIEGRMYGPLGAAVIASLLGALLLALTLTPVAAGRLLRPRAKGASEDVWLVRRLKLLYAPALDACMRHAGRVRVISLLLTLPALLLGSRIGADFMPELDEGALILNTILPSEASLEQVDLLNHRVEDVLRTFPEVKDVVRRTGRSERTEDPMPHTLSDVLVVLDPDRQRSTETLVAAMREKLTRIPGLSVLFTTPLMMRIDEGLGGTPADLSVRIFGPDFDVLQKLAGRARVIVSQVKGIADLRVEQLTGVPQLRVRIDRAAVARVGLTPGDVTRAVRIGLVGEQISEVVRGQRRFDLIVRLQDDARAGAGALRRLWIDGHDGTRIPLGQLAQVEEGLGIGAIRREAGSRRVALEASVAGRDLASTAQEVQTRLAQQLPLPTGYFVDLGGRVENQARASRALGVAIAAALLCVFALLYLALGSLADALVILATLPDALVGGILALWLWGETWNVSSLVGLIGLFGIAVQNGLVLISQTRALLAQGKPFDEALREACLSRVRPKLMTAATAILGLLPLLVLELPGTEIERPLAVVMIGGLVTSTLFTLLALPTFYALVHALRERASARLHPLALVFCCLIPGLPGASAHAQEGAWPEQISWPQLAELVQTRSARLELLEARVSEVQTEEAFAARLPNPVVAYTGYGRVSGSAQAINGSQHQAELEQELPLWGQRKARRAAAQAGSDVARALQQVQLTELLVQARHTFIELYISDARLALLERALTRIAEARVTIEGRLRAGMLSQYDLTRAELEEIRLLGERDAETAHRTGLQGHLAELVGMPGWTPHAVEDAASLTQLRPDGMPRSELPAQREARALERAAGLRVEQARRERLPTPSAKAGAYLTTEGGSASWLLGLSLPIPVLDTGRVAIDKAQASVRSAQALRSVLGRHLEARFAAAVRTLDARQAAYQRYAQGVPERLARLRDMADAAYRAGTVNILVLMDAVRAQVELELETTDALAALLHADTELRVASGLLQAR